MPLFAHPVDVPESVEVPESWKVEIPATAKYDIFSIKYVVKRSGNERTIYKVDRWEIVDAVGSKSLQWILHFSKRRYCGSHVIKQVDECLLSELSKQNITVLEDLLCSHTARPDVDAGEAISPPLSFEEAKDALARYYGVIASQVAISINSQVKG